MPAQSYRRKPCFLETKREKSAPGHMKIKELLIIMASSNATGNHQLKLFVIGKSAKSTALKNVNLSEVPVIYTHQNNVWMNHEILKNGFLNSFVSEWKKLSKEKGLPCKGIFTIDNDPRFVSNNKRFQFNSTNASGRFGMPEATINLAFSRQRKNCRRFKQSDCD